MSVTSTAPTPCQKCQLPTGSVSYYIGGIRLCGLCYSSHLAQRAGGSAASPAPEKDES